MFSWKLVNAGLKNSTSGFYKLVLVLAIVVITSDILSHMQHCFKFIFNVKNIYLNSVSLDTSLYFLTCKNYHICRLCNICTFFFLSDTI